MMFERYVETLYAWLVVPADRPDARREKMRLLRLAVCLALPSALMTTIMCLVDEPLGRTLKIASTAAFLAEAVLVAAVCSRISRRAAVERPESLLAAPVGTVAFLKLGAAILLVWILAEIAKAATTAASIPWWGAAPMIGPCLVAADALFMMLMAAICMRMQRAASGLG